jgi:hypothetical protein
MKKQYAGTPKYSRWLWLFCFAYFFYLMLAITLRYIPIHPDVAFLQIKQTEITTVPAYFYIFYIHVLSSIFVLLAGFTQFNQKLLARYPRIHRNIGKIYVYTVLFFSAPSGIYIGYYANGGLFAKISFMTLGTLWFTFTLYAMLQALKRKIISHKKFMLRSFALAFSAITLRMWKVVIVLLFHPNPMDVYKIIAWLGWIPNLLLIEWYIAKKIRK